MTNEYIWEAFISKEPWRWCKEHFVGCIPLKNEQQLTGIIFRGIDNKHYEAIPKFKKLWEHFVMYV